MSKKVRVALLGCGTIGGYVMEAIVEQRVDNLEIAVVCVRSMASKGVGRAKELGLPVITDPGEIGRHKVDIVAENASQEALGQWGESILEQGMSLIPMSLGALVDGSLLERMKAAAYRGGCKLIVPSGGVGGLDAIRGAMVGGIESAELICRKPPEAWKDIPYVEKRGWDMDSVTEPLLLYEGPAKDCVKEFPQNVNIAAALSLASVGFDRTKVTIYADPTIVHNTHQIICRGVNGNLSFQFENVPVPTYPKTTYQACASVAAALERFASSYCVGT